MRRPATLIGLGLLAAVCLPVGVAPAQDKHEPNNDFDHAAAAKLNQKVPFVIATDTDRDYFKMTVAKAGYLRVLIGASGVNRLDPYATIYDAKRKKLGEWEARLEPGTVYVMIEDRYQNASSTKPLVATFTFTPENDPGEVNDDFDRAKPAKLNEKLRFVMMPKWDRDHFKLTITEAGYLRVIIPASGVNALDPYATIYDAKRKKLGEWEARLEPGTAYVMIEDRYQNASSTKPLVATFTFTPETDPGEVNDDFDHAAPAKLNEKLRFVTMPKWDRDYFKLTIAKAGYVRVLISASGVDRLDPYATIYDAKRKKLGEWEARLEPGDAYVMIEDKYQNASSTKPLVATVQFFAETDPGEPNGSPEKARAIEIGKAVKTSIMPRGDVDWFKVDVPEAGYLRCALGKTDQRQLDPYVEMYGETGALISKTGAARVLGPTTVRLKVADHYDNASSPNSFPVEVTFQPEFDAYEWNDAPRYAAVVALSKWLHVGLCPAGDVDHFKVTVPEAGYLVAQVRGKPKDLPVYLALCDESGKAITTGWAHAVQPGDYLLKLNSDSRGQSEEPFQLRFTFRPEFDELEAPADKPKAIEFGRAYQVAFYPRGDRDHWRIKLDRAGYVQLRVLDAAPDLRMLVRVLKGKDAVWEGPPHFRLDAGEYVVEALDASGRERPGGFLLAPVFEPEFDPAEPNHSKKRAKLVKPDQAVKAYLYPAGETDWYTFRAPAKGTLRLLAATEAGESVPLQGRAVSADGKTRLAFQGPVGAVALAPGEYVLEVSTPQTIREPVELRFRWVPDSGAVPPSTAGGLTVALIGLKLSERDRKAQEDLARATRSLHVTADDTRSITRAMEAGVKEAVKVAKAGAPSPAASDDSGGFPWWLLGALLVLLLIVVILRRRRASTGARK